MRLTSIDIGTNTILMLIADVSPDGAIVPVRDEQVITRLGKGVDFERRISPETTDRVLACLQNYKAISESLHSEVLFAGGTSALRDATNRQEFIGRVRRELGIQISILSGEEEAELTYRGAVSEFLVSDTDIPLAVLDIGGGSTELTIGKGANVTEKMSLDVGSVRLTERILLTSPPSLEALTQATNQVRSWTSRLPRLPSRTKLMGVAGTVTTLAAIDLKLTNYDRSKVSGYFLHMTSIERIYEKLRTCTVPEIMSDFPMMETGRADIITAGVLILIESLRALGAEGIIVSDRGLRYGMALRAFSSRNDKK